MKNLGDDNPQTAWVEGAKGHGIGEYIEFSETVLFGPYDGKARFSILNGLQSRESSWKNNSRVKEMDLFINGNLVARVTLLDSMGIQTFSIPYPKLEDGKHPTVRFQIVSVYPGAKYEDTAIAEIYQCGG